MIKISGLSFTLTWSKLLVSIFSVQEISDRWMEGRTDGWKDRLITIGRLQSGALINFSCVSLKLKKPI